MKKRMYLKPRVRKVAANQENPLLASSATFHASAESLGGGGSIDFS